MDYKIVNDYELLYMIKNNFDEDSYNILFEKYKPLINKKIQKWSFILNKYNLYIEDLRQDLNLCIIKTINNYDESKNALFYSYLNICLDGYIKNFLSKYIKEDHNISLDDELNENFNLYDILSDNKDNPDIKINVKELEDFLYEYLLDLNSEQRLIFEMHLEGYRVREISYITGKTSGSIRTIISRNIAKFKKEMFNKKIINI